MSALDARIDAADGRSYIDFAGGIGSLNLGHRTSAVVNAVHEQVERYLHQCFSVVMYEPYVEVCRRLGRLSPCRGAEQHSVLLNSGAEAVENAVKIARAATGRPNVIAFDRGFHGRTMFTLSLSSGVLPHYTRGFAPFAPEVVRAPAPYEYRGIGTDDAIAGVETLLAERIDPGTVACMVLEPLQGEGGFIPMPSAFVRRLRELCDRHGILYVDDEVQAGMGRTGRVWAIEHLGVEPDLLVTGKSIGGGLPLSAVCGSAELVDAVEPGGLGGTFGGNPVSCAAANVVLEAIAKPEFRRTADELERSTRAALAAMVDRYACIGDVRGLGPMLALELVDDAASRTPSADRARRVVTAARRRGLLLLACGASGNVIRLLPPITIARLELERALQILDASLAEADAR